MSELVTDEMVETAAATSWAHDHSMPWDMAPSDVRDYYLDGARAALEAVAPLIAAKALRDAVEAMVAEDEGGVVAGLNDGDAGLWLIARADRIEANP